MVNHRMSKGSNNSNNSSKSRTGIIIYNSIDVDFTISNLSEDDVGEKIQHIRDVVKQEFNADALHIHLSEEVEEDDEEGEVDWVGSQRRSLNDNDDGDNERDDN